MKKTLSPTKAEIPLMARKPLRHITNFGFIFGGSLSVITLALFIAAAAVGDMSLALCFYAFSLFCSIPIGLLVCLIVSLRILWLKYRFRIDSLGKPYLLGKAGIILCLFPSILMAMLLLRQYLFSNL